ncbi:MAG: XRE family transcriptional regulator [Rubrivivax sp.]|nr:MAG: XRE family transcriptional regulator [Rubrivivax sp.]
MSHQTIKNWRKDIAPVVQISFKSEPNRTGTAVRFALPATAPSGTEPAGAMGLLQQRSEWRDKEYRDLYMEEAVDQGIAWQIRINRERRGLSQKRLAETLGTQQSAVSRLEDPDYGAHSLDTLKELARAFDCALLLKLVPYSVLASEREHLSPDDLYAPPFTAEVPEQT